jgi:hypothetical protein
MRKLLYRLRYLANENLIVLQKCTCRLDAQKLYNANKNVIVLVKVPGNLEVYCAAIFDVIIYMPIMYLGQPVVMCKIILL